jgi:Complex 1 protein (LYR family)
MSIARSDVRKLYRALLRHSARFTDYNFREYALRRTREEFRSAMYVHSSATLMSHICTHQSGYRK